MKDLIDALFVVFGIGVCLGLIVCFMVFLWSLMIEFLKHYIFISKPHSESCRHSSTVYTDKHPELKWTCLDCGNLIS